MGLARTPKEVLVFKYSLPIGIGLIFAGALDFIIALKGLRQLKIWSGICAVLLCFISGVFFYCPSSRSGIGDGSPQLRRGYVCPARLAILGTDEE